MPKFIVNTNFQFYGVIRRKGSSIEVTEEILTTEIAKGTKEVKEKNGSVTSRPLSGLLNHCTPADKETAKLCEGILGEKPEEIKLSIEEKAARVEEIKALMDKMGKAYRNNWGLKKLEDELKKARIETGE
jgi:hypothetical protein